MSPAALLAFAVVGFATLVIFGSGMLSLLTNRDVIDTPGLGPVPGPLAYAAAAGVFAVTLRPVLRAARPRYTTVVVVTLATALTHLAALWILALVFGADVAIATAAAGGAATSWPLAVVAGSAAVAAWAAIAVRRTAARPPTWPWERGEDDE